MSRHPPVLFLDIDGVLNCPDTWRRNDGQRGTFRLCPDRIARLVRLLEEVDARVVLSSTWRKFVDHREYLDKCAPSVTFRFLKDWRTTQLMPVSTGNTRGREIKEYLDRHPEITTYAIVNDDSDMLPSQRPYFVQTNHQDGLLDKDCLHLHDILTGGPGR